MHDRRAVDAVERTVDRGEAVARRLVGRGAHPGLVELDDVDAGRLQFAHFLVDRDGIVHRELCFVGVELVLHLLRQGERARHGDLGRVRRVRDQELGVAALDGALAADAAGDARHRRRPAVRPDHRADIDRVEPVEREAEIVGIALAPHLAVADDIDADALHLADRDDRRVVLRLLEVRRRGCARSRARGRAARRAFRARRGRSANRAADSCRQRWSGSDGSDRSSRGSPASLGEYRSLGHHARRLFHLFLQSKNRRPAFSRPRQRPFRTKWELSPDCQALFGRGEAGGPNRRAHEVRQPGGKSSPTLSSPRTRR